MGSLLRPGLGMALGKRMVGGNGFARVPGAKSLLLLPLAAATWVRSDETDTACVRCHKRGNIAESGWADNGRIEPSSLLLRPVSRTCYYFRDLPVCLAAHGTLVIATRNAHKVGEIRAILGTAFSYLTLNDFPEPPEVVEDAGTFAGNATKKAVALAQWLAQGGGFRDEVAGRGTTTRGGRYSCWRTIRAWRWMR